MNSKKYLVYLDILGFEKLATEIALKKGIEEVKLRKDFIEVIKEKIEKLVTEDKILGKKYGESDDWLLVVDSIDKVFSCIFEILDHNTGYKNYEKIPMEIAIGVAKYGKYTNFEGKNLVIENDTIKFYKTNIVKHYCNWYKSHHNIETKCTFIVITEQIYYELELLDRKMCKKIEYIYRGDKQSYTFFIVNIDKIQQRGKMFEFLQKIGYAFSRWYRRIDEVYVPPNEYKEMITTLKEKRILFITGTQEYGKTYTAVRILWDYYCCGYEPKWIKGEEISERINVRKKLVNILYELKPRNIIYFEDPFGKTKYESTESLEREIGSIIESIILVEDVYVIITSREEVFKEFEKENLSEKELKKFEKKLNIKKTSYNYQKRKEILLKWAKGENCKWLNKKILKNNILEYMRDEKILPTPLSIKNFVIATTDVEKKSIILKKIEEKSKETEKAFAREIRCMSDDKILFLSFLFISDNFKIKFIISIYQEMARELNLEKPWEFERILNWFIDDKINITFGQIITFSHSSYSETLKYLLVEDDGYPTHINRDIFSKLLVKLSEKGKAVKYVIRTVADNFDKLPKDVSNLLFTLSEKETSMQYVMEVVYNFKRLPEDIRNKLLLKLSKKDKTVSHVVSVITRDFDKLPQNIRSLLFYLSDKDKTACYVATAVSDNFNALPVDVRNKLLLKLSENNKSAWYVAWIVARNFNALPVDVRNKLLLKLSEKEKTACYIKWVVKDNFDKLPVDVRNKLLIKLSEKGETGIFVIGFVADNFNKLQEDIRNKLLLMLLKNDKIAHFVTFAVADNFDKLSQDVKYLINKRKIVGRTILKANTNSYLI